MASDLKRALRDNLRMLIERSSGALKPNESGVTRLLKLGLSNGNAQRLLDEESTVSFSTLEQVAKAFRVNPWDLLNPGMQASEMPYRDLSAFEGQLIETFRKLPHDRQLEYLIELRDEIEHEHKSPASAYAGVERRSAVRFEQNTPTPNQSALSKRSRK